MANYKFVDADQLDSDLSGIANAIRKKGGTSASMSFPNGFSSAINAISTGVTVQVKTGTVTGVSGTNKTVNCGFKPDIVIFTGINQVNNNDLTHACAAFTADNATSVDTLFIPSNTSYVFSYFTVTQTTDGFSVKGIRLDFSLQSSNESNRTLNYIAIKYT